MRALAAARMCVPGEKGAPPSESQSHAECACEPGYTGDDCSVGGEHSITPIAKDGADRTLLLDFEPSTLSLIHI